MSDVRHITSERCELAKWYPGKSWIRKVSQMTDDEVHVTLEHLRNKKAEEKKDDQI